MDVKTIKDKLQVELKAARDLCVVAEGDGDRDLTADERKQVAEHLKTAKGLKDQLVQAQEDAALRAAIAELGGAITLADHDGRPFTPGAPAGSGKSLGELFVEAGAFKQWMKQIAPKGNVPESLKGLTSPPIDFGSMLKLVGMGRKTLVTGADDTQAGAFVQTDYTGIYEPLGRYPLNIRSLISVRQTTSDLVEFVRQVTQVTQAAPTPEANVKEYTGASGEEEGRKPQGAMAFEKVQTGVKTIAVYAGATKRALSDAAQIRGIIDQELRDDIAEELEDQIINGDGIGENFTGIMNTASVLVQAFDTDIFRTTRKAKTSLRVTGKTIPTAWVLNPADWEEIELTQDGQNRYYYGGPISNGEPRLWGVPVVESETVAEHTALLGNWRKAVLWDREQTNISVTDSHDDWFVRNMIAILAEMRAAFGVIRPTGFIKVSLQ